MREKIGNPCGRSLCPTDFCSLLYCARLPPFNHLIVARCWLDQSSPIVSVLGTRNRQPQKQDTSPSTNLPSDRPVILSLFGLAPLTRNHCAGYHTFWAEVVSLFSRALYPSLTGTDRQRTTARSFPAKVLTGGVPLLPAHTHTFPVLHPILLFWINNFSNNHPANRADQQFTLCDTAPVHVTRIFLRPNI